MIHYKYVCALYSSIMMIVNVNDVLFLVLRVITDSVLNAFLIPFQFMIIISALVKKETISKNS
jgi:hypothetical protein